MKLSVVTTMYHSSPYLEEFYNRIDREVVKITDDYELIFVNDGSPDNALQVALDLQNMDRRIRVIDLSRNFGHHKAMMTGLEHARGDLVFLIDVDLEEPPESLSIFYEVLKGSDADVAFGVQDKRLGPWFSRVTGRLFYKVFNLLSDHSVTPNSLTARLMSNRYVAQLVRHKEHLFFIEGLWAITGFKQIPVIIDKLRYKGTSTYSLRKKVAHAIYAITAFSSKPLLMIAYLGLLMTIGCGGYIMFLLFQYFLFGVSVDGWTSLIVSVWFLSGVIIFNLGVISTYLYVIFIEAKVRPYSIVRQMHETPRTETKTLGHA